MPQSRLPQGGVNKFQAIKAVTDAAEAQGKKLIKLTIGEPQVPALLSASEEAARLIKLRDVDVHGYQDNHCKLAADFEQRFVAAHVDWPGFFNPSSVSWLSIPGIKPMLGLVPIATGLTAAGRLRGTKFRVGLTTNPGYPTPRDWARDYLGADTIEFELIPQNSFRFDIDAIPGGPYDLIMMNYPHNPTGQVATRVWMNAVCRYCELHNIRLFNDAAYAALTQSRDAVTLSEVAIRYPGLSWIEAFSASKSIGNGTGWRVGAAVGSHDAIGDLGIVGGNTHSGFNAALAMGALYALEHDKEGVQKNRLMYSTRLNILRNVMEDVGMQLAIEPHAGFFSLWRTPNFAFGKPVVSAEAFNTSMITETGVVGVHFDPYMRYAVVDEIQPNLMRIHDAFKKAEVRYS